VTAIPKAAHELEEWLSDPAKMGSLFDEEGKATPQFTEFMSNYAAASVRKDETISQQIEEQVQASMAEYLKANGSKTKKIDLGGRALSARATSAPGARADGVFGNRADFLFAAAMGSPAMGDRLGGMPELVDQLGKLSKIQNSYGTTIPADGGFLVPEEFRQDIMQVALETAITRPRATIIPMSTATLDIPAVDETTHASQSLFGGVICYWAAEAATLTASSAKFAKVRLDASKLTAYAEVPSELSEDAPAFDAWFMANMPKALTWSEDYAFVNGNGVGQPLGWLNSPAAISVTKETAQTADTIVWQNVIKMFSRMLPTSLGSAVWVANIDTLYELASMAQQVGTGGSTVWINNGTEGPPARILGRPLYFTEKVPTVGDAGDISLVDLSYYAIGDRQAMRWGVSKDLLFQSDELAYRLIQRVDGRPLLLSALTPAQSTATLSAFVKLAVRA